MPQVLDIICQLACRNQVLGAIDFDGMAATTHRDMACSVPAYIAQEGARALQPGLDVHDGFWQHLSLQLALRGSTNYLDEFTWLWGCPYLLQWTVDAAIFKDKHPQRTSLKSPSSVAVNGKTLRLSLSFDAQGGALACPDVLNLSRLLKM